MRLQFVATLLLAISSFSPAAFAFDQWQQPSSEELKMTTDTAAPGAPAVYLFREEISDDKLRFHSLYVRMKILTEKGKSYADIEIPYEKHLYSITNVEGRTIHADGTIVPFTGKPYEKLLVKYGGRKEAAKVFSMPAAEVGSILEYRYTLRYDDNMVSSPLWLVQQPLFLHKGHFRFIPIADLERVLDAHGSSTGKLLYEQNLPKGVEVKQIRDNYELNVSNIQELPDEDFMPPLQVFSYRVRFYYSTYTSGAEFWKSEGKFWSKQVDHFANATPEISSAVNQITAGADTPEKKLTKLYSTLMGIENTDFTRRQSDQELKASGLKEAKNAGDIWKQKRGSSDEIAMLFLSMARAAGLKAYAMQVVNRDTAFFNANFLSLSQLDDIVVAVNVGDKERWFDPGSKYCGYGLLDWKHSWAGGLRQTDSGTIISTSGGPAYPENQRRQIADLFIDESGSVSGTLRLFMQGNIALRWRQKILKSDVEEAKHDLEEELNRELPEGLQATVKGFMGQDTYDTQLAASAEVKGHSASLTKTRYVLPLDVFQARRTSTFADREKRLAPIDLQYPYVEIDRISLTVPASWTIESAPKQSIVQLQNLARMALNSKTAGNTVSMERVFALSAFIFKPEEYSEVHGFFEKVNTADQQQVVLKKAAAEGN